MMRTFSEQLNKKLLGDKAVILNLICAIFPTRLAGLYDEHIFQVSEQSNKTRRVYPAYNINLFMSELMSSMLSDRFCNCTALCIKLKE